MKKEKFGMILPIVLLSYFLILLDNSIVFTGTIQISHDLHLTMKGLTWVSNSYALSFGGLLLIMGRIGDLIGRKKIFIVGLVIFALGSLFVGCANSLLVMIPARVFQGIGSSIIAPTSMALLLDNYQGKMLTKAIGYYGATAGLGGISGLIIGGLVTELFSWRIGFLINVPVALLVALLSAKFIKDSVHVPGKIDYCGAVLALIGMVSLVYSIEGTQNNVWYLLLAVLAVIILIVREKWAQQPLLPLTIFQDKERIGAYLGRFIYSGVIFAYFFLTPQILQKGLGFSTLMSGVGFLPMSLSQFIVGIKLDVFTSRFGNTKTLIVGLIFSLVGFSIPTLLGLQCGYWLTVALPMVIIGIGQALTISPLTVSSVVRTNANEAGAASGVTNTAHQIGSSVGLALITVLIAPFKSTAAMYQHAMRISLSLVVLTFIVVWFTIHSKNKKEA